MHITNRPSRPSIPVSPSVSRLCRVGLLASTSLGLLVWQANPAAAACVFAPAVGDDVYTCNSGTSGTLSDLTGNNTLLFPAGSTGMIAGNVEFGEGADTITMDSGTIDGFVNQGDGRDSFTISAGTVVGNVQQGAGIDDFIMTGGTIGSLNQGDNLDTFFMSGGRIIDAFDDGDRAIMTGGRIGRVNLKLDNNLFDMSGGTIDRNLVAGFGNDTIILSAGTIGGNISVSGGTDSVTITGGSVGGNVLLSFGTDTFIWDGGGIVYGAIDLGPDNDIALLANLTNANLGATQEITGGLGTDALTLDHVATPGVNRFQNWESIALTNDTQLTFDGDLLLGDNGTNTGALTIDQTSTIYGGNFNSGIRAVTAGQLVTVTNSGRLDLTNNNAATDTFTIGGNYIGGGGALLLDTVLGDDSSASDQLVIAGGAASGATGISIFNQGGAGAATVADGIRVVQTTNGGTTASGAFALNGSVAAGAFEYLLFKGGVTPGSGQDWFLRSTLVQTPTPPEPAPAPSPIEEPQPAPAPIPPDPILPAPPPPAQPAPALPPEPTDDVPDPVDPAPPVDIGDAAPEAPPAPPPAPEITPPPPPPVPGTVLPPLPIGNAAPPNPGASRVEGDVVPLYRVEVPVYSAMAPAARYMGLAAIGTFHERRGQQSLLAQQNRDAFPGAWGRVYGQNVEVKTDGTVAPTFDGDIYGLQAGADLFGQADSSGHSDRAGVIFGYSHLNADIAGQALGWNDLDVGSLSLKGTSLGAYWSHTGPEGWYLDGVILGTWYDGSASSNRGIGIDLNGNSIAASLEGGIPIALNETWTLEPQAQLIWQHLSIDDQSDRFSPVAFQLDDTVTGRIGLQLEGDVTMGDLALEPYLKANLWQQFGGTDTVSFAGAPITTHYDGTSLELGAGVVARLSDTVSVFATGDYTTNLGGGDRQVFEGNIGISVKW